MNDLDILRKLEEETELRKNLWNNLTKINLPPGDKKIKKASFEYAAFSHVTKFFRDKLKKENIEVLPRRKLA